MREMHCDYLFDLMSSENYNINRFYYSGMLLDMLAIWGCLYELGGDCIQANDISNASSMWVGIAVGAGIGSGITWWIYNRQKKTSDKQDEVLRRYRRFGEKSRAHIRSNTQFGEKN